MQPTNNAGAGRETAEGKWSGRPVHYFPRRLIVKLKTPTDAAEAVAMAGEADGRRRRRRHARAAPSHTGRLVIELGEGAQGARRGQEVRASAPTSNTPSPTSSTRRRSSQRHALRGAVGAPRSTLRAPGTWRPARPRSLIGIIDSGISMSAGGALDHPDLNDAGRYHARHRLRRRRHAARPERPRHARRRHRRRPSRTTPRASPA